MENNGSQVGKLKKQAALEHLELAMEAHNTALDSMDSNAIQQSHRELQTLLQNYGVGFLKEGSRTGLFEEIKGLDQAVKEELERYGQVEKTPGRRSSQIRKHKETNPSGSRSDRVGIVYRGI